ncbi:urea ABC transporter substrate-binding protein [Paenibacillus marchantiophytorum]|uniref:Urea ABC transporter substrate-binding protein n=1 Tax=Paenibacillus marchantiophytorum TaxID=1619310 RepID=A0ABQ1EL94_9BACL|nr:urea ABC transporter substrate-binding protein [Paenibacillus marchantiophytorum]GFZ76969.1 urea ABC transporter substrate-binding protein [Paenibacillus marchantiophytorum]
MREIRNKGKLTVALSMAIMLVIAGCAKSVPTASTSTTPKASTAAEVKADSKDDTVPVGILHSLTGTMSISEVSVRDAELMAIDEINAAGGLLGKKIKPVIEDGASDWPTFAEKTKKLLQKDSVVTIFGCWTSASRKAVLPVVEQNKGLLWYPVQYEGVESSPNIFYIGATTNQQIIPAVTWLLQNKGKKFYLLGSDYVFPRTANKIIKEQLKAEGGTLIAEEYTPLGHTDYNTIISKIKKDKPDVIFNTLNGDSNVAFFKQLKDAGITAKDITTMSVSIAEEEVRGIGASVLDGHYTAWNYYQTTDTPENKKFVEAYKAKYGKDRVTDDPIEAGYTAVYLWAAAVKKAGSFEVEKVKAAAKGIEFNAPEGKVVIDGENQHISKTARIGQITADGQIKEIWNSGQPLKPDPFLKTYPWGGEVTKK